MILKMREDGLSDSSINSYTRTLSSTKEEVDDHFLLLLCIDQYLL